MAVLINADTRILVQGITGREAVAVTRAGLDYGARVVAGVTPGKGGQEVHGVPVFDSVRQAIERVGPVDVALVSVPPAAARDAVFEAAGGGIPLVVVSTERVPRHDVAQLLAYAAARGCRVIGPNTMGLIVPGKTKIGSVGGPAEDTRRAYVPGPVGIMSRSGGMTTEIASLLTLNGLGQSTCISIGGDPLIGSTFADLYPLFDEDPDTGVVVMYTEPGGTMEADLAAYIAQKAPVTHGVVFVSGRFMDEMPGVRFGHAGTIVQGKADSAAEKTRLLREAGFYVADTLQDIPGLVRRALAESRKPGRWVSVAGNAVGNAARSVGPAAAVAVAGEPVSRRRAGAAAAGHDTVAAPGRRPPVIAGRGLFVNLAVADGCVHADGCRICIDACPVDIFAPNIGGKVAVQGHLEDECILCGLCVERCPERVVEVIRLYDRRG
jgi:succinyl-CoA synthetase alpha subunit